MILYFINKLHILYIYYIFLTYCINKIYVCSKQHEYIRRYTDIQR